MHPSRGKAWSYRSRTAARHRRPVGADGLFDIHAGQVAVEHGGGLDQRFSQRHDGKFDGEAPGFGNAALDHIGQLAEVRITRRQFRPGVANADDGFTAETLDRGCPGFSSRRGK